MTSYTMEIADQILERIADGESLVSICRSDGMPNKSTVFRWLAADKTFCDKYARAREAQADTYADEIIGISDDGRRDYTADADGRLVVDHDHIARSRLRVEARKWIASKLQPKKYGDKVVQQNQQLDADGNAMNPSPTLADFYETVKRIPLTDGDDKV